MTVKLKMAIAVLPETRDKAHYYYYNVDVIQWTLVTSRQSPLTNDGF